MRYLLLAASFIGLFLFYTICSPQPIEAADGEVTYTGTNTNLTGDDIGAGPFGLGFTFNYYGVGYTSAFVNINGTISFLTNYSRYDNQPLNTAISGTNIADNTIYAFWDDLNTNPSGGSGNKPIYYGTVGTAPNRIFVTQWTNIYFHGTTVQMGTFQILLYEGSNIIQIQYRDLLGNASQPNREKGNSATIGIRKNNTNYSQYSHNSASLTQGQAIRYTPNDSNSYTVNTDADYELVYLAPAGAPTSPTLVTPTDGTNNITTQPTFEWLPVESATSYRVLISTVSNFSNLVADQTTTSTSYTHGSTLNTSAQYYWRVQATNSNGSSLSSTRTFTTAATANTAPNTPSSVTSATLIGGTSITSLAGAQLTANLTDDDADEQVRYRIQIATDNAFNSLVIDYRSSFGAEGTATYTFGESGGTYLVGSTATTLAEDDYYLRIRTEDDSAASSSWYTASGIAFTIAADATPPEISAISSSPGSTSATVSWTTDEVASSQIEYGLVPVYGFQTAETNTSPRVITHTVNLTNLKACARYFYRIKSKDAANNEVISSIQNFITTGCATSNIVSGTESTFVDSVGGTVDLVNDTSRATLEIPAGFSDSNASFQINILENSSMPSPPDNRQIAGNNIFDLIAVKDDDTQLTEFDTPITFSITYGSDIESEFEENTLGIYKYIDSAWEDKNCTLDMDANTLTCTLSSFSVYSLLGKPKSDDPTPTPTVSVTSSPSSLALQTVLAASTVCSEAKPEYAPDLFQIDTTDASATVYFTPILGITKYYISYSENASAEEHGALVELGSEGVQQFKIELLSPQKTYYFKIRGQRGCMPGEWSNIKSTYTGVVLQIQEFSQTQKAEPVAKKTENKTVSKLNPTTIPSPSKKIENKQILAKAHTLKLKIEHEGKPLANANVEIHSRPQYGKTDENGYVVFTNVEKGEHTLKIAYNSYKAEQKLKVDGEKEQVDIKINVELKENSLLPTWGWLTLIGLMVGVFIILLRRKK